jgi:hypothetical protein
MICKILIWLRVKGYALSIPVLLYRSGTLYSRLWFTRGELYDSGIRSGQEWQVELYKMTSQCFLFQFVVSYSPFFYHYRAPTSKLHQNLQYVYTIARRVFMDIYLTEWLFKIIDESTYKQAPPESPICPTSAITRRTRRGRAAATAPGSAKTKIEFRYLFRWQTTLLYLFRWIVVTFWSNLSTAVQRQKLSSAKLSSILVRNLCVCYLGLGSQEA